MLHKVIAFIAPKFIGGGGPTPLAELGFEKMTEALPVSDVSYDTYGPDLSVTGYLPVSGGLEAVSQSSSRLEAHAVLGTRVAFYKAWDAFGALSNFSPHPIRLAGEQSEWATVEVCVRAGAWWCGCRLTRMLHSVILPGAEIRKSVLARGSGHC